jgi:hypothetical protein
MNRFAITLLALFTAFLFVPASHAQTLEFYGTVTGLYATNVPTQGGLPQTPPANTNTSTHSIGFGGGGTYNLLHIGIFQIGLDARGSNHLGLGGVKLTAHVPVFKLKPYVQGSVGYFNALHNGIDNRYTAAEFLAGVDIPLIRNFDLRVVEVGLGHAVNNNDGSKPTFITASTGVVIHF